MKKKERKEAKKAARKEKRKAKKQAKKQKKFDSIPSGAVVKKAIDLTGNDNDVNDNPPTSVYSSVKPDDSIS